MGYHVVDPTEIEATPDRPCERRSVSDAVGLEQMALNYYCAAPGEQLPLAYHVHDTQEEAFYVIERELHVETPGGDRVVPEESLFVVEPGSPQRAYNPDDADGDVHVLAIGAPPVDDVSPYESTDG